MLAKLVESPVLRHRRRPGPRRRRDRVRGRRLRARVVDVVRLGDDQALVLEPSGRAARRRARVARVDRRPAARPSATTPRRTSCTRRCASGSARTCARRAPTSARTSCASTSRTARRSAHEDVWVEDRVNEMILANQPVRALDDDARRGQSPRRDGAVRREVRRRRADGRGRRRRLVARAVRRHARPHAPRRSASSRSPGDLQRRQRAPDRGHHRAAAASGCCAARPRAARRRRALRTARRGRRGGGRRRSRSAASSRRAARARPRAADAKPTEIVDIGGVRAVFEIREVASPKALPDVADRLRGELGDPAVIVLGAPGEGRASLLVARHAGRRRRGVKAGASSRSRRPWSAAAAAGATTWRRRAARTRRSCRRRWPPPAPRSSARSPVEGRRPRLRVGALRRRGERSHGDARDAADPVLRPAQEGLRGVAGA